MGYQSGNGNTTGSNNTANGYESLTNNTIGSNNTANGYQSLSSNTDGVNNTANGYQSLRDNTEGGGNIRNSSVPHRFLFPRFSQSFERSEKSAMRDLQSEWVAIAYWPSPLEGWF